MIADTWLLLTLRWRIGWNNFRSRKVPMKVLTVLGLFWAGVVMAFFSTLIGGGAGFLLRTYDRPGLAALIPGLILTAETLLLFISSFGVVLGSLFLTSDLDTLMTAPVDRRAVFVSKILDGLIVYYALLAVTAVPALLAYGLGVDYGPLYYLLVFVAVASMPLLPSGLAAVLVMLVARFAPARRVKEVLGLFGALFGLTCGVLGQTSRLWTGQLARSGNSIDALADNLRGLSDIPIPPMFAGKALAAAGRGDWPTFALSFAGFLIFTFGFFALVVLLADRLYAAGWVRMQSSGSSKRSKQRAERAASRSGLLGRAPAFMAIVLKDWRVIPRDLRNFAQLLAPLIFLPIFYFNFLGGRRAPFSDGGSDFLGGFDGRGIFIAIGILVGTGMVFGRIADTAISMEGKAWWLLKIAPVSGAEILRGKFLSAMIPFSVLSTLLLVGAGIWNGFNPLWALYGWFGVQLLGAGMMAISVALSVPWARLNWDDPRRMTSGVGSVLAIVGWAVMGIIAGGILCLPAFVEVYDRGLVPLAVVAAVVLSSLIVAGSAYGALRFGVSRLGSVGEA